MKPSTFCGVVASALALAACSVTRIYVDPVKDAPAGTFDGACAVGFEAIDASSVEIGEKRAVYTRGNSADPNSTSLEKDLTTMQTAYARELDARAPKGQGGAATKFSVRTKLLQWEPGFWGTNFVSDNSWARARVEVVSAAGEVAEAFQVRTEANSNIACPTSECHANGVGAGLGIQVAQEIGRRMGCAH